MVCTNSEKEGLRNLFKGEVRRSIARNSAYPASHLATSVITFHVTNTSLVTSWGTVTTAKVITRLVTRIYKFLRLRDIENRESDRGSRGLIRNFIETLDAHCGSSWYRDCRKELLLLENGHGHRRGEFNEDSA